MTLEEAITIESTKAREWRKYNLPSKGVNYHDLYAKWLKELKGYKDKNEPKLVIYSGDGYADGKMVYDWAECPKCDYEFEDGDDNWEMPFCPSCGQALKWEEEE